MTHAVSAAVDDDLGAQLASAAGRRWWNRWTVVLGVALLLVGGFVTGVEVQKAYGSSSSSSGAVAGAGAGQRGAGGYGGFPGGGLPTAFPGGAASDATAGTVKLIDGTTVYVETASGELVTVRTDGETAVQVPGALKDLKAGDKVTVQGEADSEGTVTATTVTESK